MEQILPFITAAATLSGNLLKNIDVLLPISLLPLVKVELDSETGSGVTLAVLPFGLSRSLQTKDVTTGVVKHLLTPSVMDVLGLRTINGYAYSFVGTVFYKNYLGTNYPAMIRTPNLYQADPFRQANYATASPMTGKGATPLAAGMSIDVDTRYGGLCLIPYSIDSNGGNEDILQAPTYDSGVVEPIRLVGAIYATSSESSLVIPISGEHISYALPVLNNPGITWPGTTLKYTWADAMAQLQAPASAVNKEFENRLLSLLDSSTDDWKANIATALDTIAAVALGNEPGGITSPTLTSNAFRNSITPVAPGASVIRINAIMQDQGPKPRMQYSLYVNNVYAASVFQEQDSSLMATLSYQMADDVDLTRRSVSSFLSAAMASYAMEVITKRSTADNTVTSISSERWKLGSKILDGTTGTTGEFTLVIPTRAAIAMVALARSAGNPYSVVVWEFIAPTGLTSAYSIALASMKAW